MRLATAILGLLCLGGVGHPSVTPGGPGRRVAPGGDRALFVFDPGDAASTPSVDRLSSTLCINGACVTPEILCDARNATADEWACTGGTLVDASSGANTIDVDTPLLGTDEAVTFSGSGEVYQAASNTLGDVTTEDMVVELVFAGDSGSNGIITKRTGNLNYWTVFTNGGTLSLRLNDGTNTATVSTAASSITAGPWYHALFVIDDSGSGQAYLNGAASGAAVAVSSVGSVTTASSLLIGALRDDFVSKFAGSLAYVALWKRASWLDTHLQADLAKDRFAQLTGVYPRIAKGDATPSTMTRASTAMLRKYSSATGVTKLFTVGAAWPRVERTSLGTGYFPETSRTNSMLQSEDIATSWTELDAGDTQSLNAVAAPDGTTTADGNIADATNGDHGFVQGVTVTAATYALSAFMKAGDRAWAALEDNQVGASTSFFNLSDCSLGTKGAGATASFIEDYGNGWCRCGISFTGTAASHNMRLYSADADNDKTITGDGATVNTYFWGMQVEPHARPTSYIKTTTASVTRQVDSLIFSATNNTLNTVGSMVCGVTWPSHNTAAKTGILQLVDTTGTDHAEMYIESTDLAATDVRVGGSSVATVTGGSDISDGSRHVIASQWTTDNVTAWVDGASVGTPDTSATAPGAFVTIRPGVARLGFMTDGLLDCCAVYGKLGVTKGACE